MDMEFVTDGYWNGHRQSQIWKLSLTYSNGHRQIWNWWQTDTEMDQQMWRCSQTNMTRFQN